MILSPLICLLGAIYYEAGNQSARGKLAVGQVIMRRAGNDIEQICNEVTSPYQFTFYKNELSLLVKPQNEIEIASYRESYSIASMLIRRSLEGIPHPDVSNGALHYHTKDISPCWNRKKKGKKIGDHVFVKQLSKCKEGDDKRK